MIYFLELPDGSRRQVKPETALLGETSKHFREIVRTKTMMVFSVHDKRRLPPEAIYRYGGHNGRAFPSGYCGA